MIKTFFHSPGSQLKMFMSACILDNLLHSKLAKNELNLTVSNRAEKGWAMKRACPSKKVRCSGLRSNCVLDQNSKFKDPNSNS